MKMKGMFLSLIFILVLGLCLVYSAFQRNGNIKPDTEEKSVASIEILVSYELSDVQEAFEKLIEDYNRLHEETEVKISWIDNEDMLKKICLSADNGEQSDLVICSNKEMPALINMGVLQEISAEMLDEIVPDKIRYPDLWQTTVNKGQYYGIPFTLDPYVLFYNASYFEKKHIKIPGTWEEILDVCETISESGISDLGFGIRRTGDAADLFDSILYVHGGTYYTLDSDAGHLVLDLLNTLKKRDSIWKNLVNYTPGDAAHDFSEEKISMILAPLSMRVFIENNKSFDKFGMHLIASGQSDMHILRGENIGILSEPDSKVTDLISYLYTAKARQRILQATGTLPLFEGEADHVVVNEELENINSNLKINGITSDNYNNWFEISSILSEHLYHVLINRNVDLNNEASTLQDEVRVAMLH